MCTGAQRLSRVSLLRFLSEEGIVTSRAYALYYTRKRAPYLANKLFAFRATDLLPYELFVSDHALTSE